VRCAHCNARHWWWDCETYALAHPLTVRDEGPDPQEDVEGDDVPTECAECGDYHASEDCEPDWCQDGAA
jgi:hypothetical protein